MLFKYFNNDRSRNVTKNILGIILTKGISIIVNLLLVSLMVNYVSIDQYGIWITLSSVIAWVSFFDIGISNGLRNKFTIAVAEGDFVKARKLVSTAYFLLGGILLGLWIILFIVFVSFDTVSFIFSNKAIDKDANALLIILLTYFCFQFVLRLISTVSTADQKPIIASIIDVLGQCIVLLVLFVFREFGLFKNSLLALGLVSTLIPLLVLFSANVYLFNSRYRVFSPSLAFFEKRETNDILGLGLKFFVIQTAGIIQYQTANFLIANQFSFKEVTSYNIAYKYFSILNMAFNILLAPQWSAVTEAYARNDFEWIRQMIRTIIYISFGFTVLGILMFVFSNQAYDFWLAGNKINIPMEVSLYTCIFFITANFSGVFISVLNGIGAVKLQFYSCLITPILFIFSSMLLIRLTTLGVASIMIAMIISNISGFIFAPVQYLMISKGKKGIWLR